MLDKKTRILGIRIEKFVCSTKFIVFFYLFKGGKTVEQHKFSSLSLHFFNIDFCLSSNVSKINTPKRSCKTFNQ